MNVLTILEPRWHDRTILIASWKIADINQIDIKHHEFPVPFYMTRELIMRCATTEVMSKSGKKLMMYVVPISELSTELPKEGKEELLENSARAFNEPIYNDDGSIRVKWVKRTITNREHKQLKTGAYKRLSQENNHVTIAWRQPIHLINNNTMEELTSAEESSLSI